MKILLTGGSGFIGTNALQHFFDQGHEVLNFDKSPPLDETQRSYWEEGDILAPEALMAAFTRFNPDAVIHLAARAECDETTTVEKGYRVNTDGTSNVLEAIKATPSVERVIIVSSQFVCGPNHAPAHDEDFHPVTVYGQSKVITEQLTREATLDRTWTIVRPTNIWGPWHQRYIYEFWKIAAKGLYVHPGGKPVIRCYGYVGNLVHHLGAILSATPEKVHGEVFYLSDPAADIYHWANAFCVGLSGKSARRVPRWVLRSLGMAGDMVSKVLGKPFYITSSRVRSMTSDYVVPGVIERTIKVLGPPRYSLEDGVRRTLAWLESSKQGSSSDSAGVMKRIVVAGQVPPPMGGQNAMIMELLNELRSRPEVAVEHLEFRFTPDTRAARRGGLAKIVELVRVIRRLIRIRAGGRIDLLVFPSGGPQKVPLLRDLLLMPWILAFSRKVLLHFHAAGFADALAAGGALPRVVADMYRRCGHALVMTDFNRRDPASCGIEDIHIIPYQLPDVFEKAAIGNGQRNEIVLLSVGHLCSDKGTPALIRAVAKLNREFPDLRLELAGEPLAPYTVEDLHGELATSGAEGCVRLLGMVSGESKRDAFARADLFVFPSVAPYESFGLVMTEAMMWCLPVLASDWRGNAAVLAGSDGGVLFSPAESEEALEAALRALLTDRQRWPILGRANRELFLQKFAKDKGKISPICRLVMDQAGAKNFLRNQL